MQLVTVLDFHLTEIMHWIPDSHSCSIWAGPEFRHPFTDATFRNDMRLELPSYSLVSDAGELLGFGQYYLRVGRCHLARLIISPHHRGRAAGAVLIRELCQRGCGELKASECSLFVLQSNTPAVRLYTRLGFRIVPYPEPMPSVEDMVYMTVPATEINN
jgi:ribosomal protein S18 acetylase RimI-like enzyme